MSSFEEIRRLINVELEKKKKSNSNPHNEGQLAGTLNISRSWFSRMMNEEKLKVTHLLKIAEILGIDPASLLPETDDPKSRGSLDEYIWSAIKEKLDKCIDEKLKKISKEG
ncbi:hypothetical protein ES703_76332 [subsurface metagenome]